MLTRSLGISRYVIFLHIPHMCILITVKRGLHLLITLFIQANKRQNMTSSLKRLWSKYSPSYMWGVVFYANVDIVSLREKIWAHETGFVTTSLLIEVHVPGQENGRSCIYMLGYRFLPLFVRLSEEFWNCSDGAVIFVFHLFVIFLICL